MPRWIPFAAALGVIAVSLGALVVATERRPPPPPASGPILTDVRQPGAFRQAPVLESSGVTTSRSHPGLLWTLNDSGNPPSLFLVDTTAAVHGFVTLSPGVDLDWEAIAGAPCGDGWCLYVGDIGDNRAIRRSVVVYRLREPSSETLAARKAAPDDALVIEYEDGPHDAESLVATPAGDLAIITKGQEGESAAYWIESSAWGTGRAVAKRFWKLPIETSILFIRLVTDAALSPDGQKLAVRTYRNLFLFGRDSTDRIPTRPLGSCPLDRLDPQGEGVSWFDDSTLVLTSEVTGLRPAPITLLRCPVP